MRKADTTARLSRDASLVLGMITESILQIEKAMADDEAATKELHKAARERIAER